jgi:serine/threonine protein kinase
VAITRGTRLGPYEITGFIGAGGMGEVYRANDTNLNRTVALKLLPIELAADPERLRRFELEARAASAINHPTIVTIYDAGQIGSQPYISMELVAGETLREILAPGALPIRRTLQIAAQISGGLAKAHELELVHRDLKPENIKVSVDGFAKILDFGLAKRTPALTEDDSRINTRSAIQTRPGLVLGTVGYMSPEQARGAPAEFRSDQFSFGAILYEMLTGRRAFERASAAETLSAIIREEPSALAQLNPRVPPPVRWIVERCLAKSPDDRYTFTRDLARDLASAREHLPEMLASTRIRTTKRAAGETSVAVLPFLNLSSDSKYEYLADGMTEALITSLTQSAGLRVISRSSSMHYKGQRKSLPDVADELGVEFVVLGSVIKAGRRMRITVQLVEAASDENRWARSYDRRSQDLLAAQGEVSAAAAGEIRNAIMSGRQNSPAAYDRRRRAAG